MHHNLQKKGKKKARSGRLVQGSERLRSFLMLHGFSCERDKALLSPFIYIFAVKAAGEASITD